MDQKKVKHSIIMLSTAAPNDLFLFQFKKKTKQNQATKHKKVPPIFYRVYECMYVCLFVAACWV